MMAFDYERSTESVGKWIMEWHEQASFYGY